MRNRLPENLENLTVRTRKYREHRRAEAAARIDMWIPADVEQAYQRLMQARKQGRKELLVSLILEAEKQMETGTDPDPQQ